MTCWVRSSRAFASGSDQCPSHPPGRGLAFCGMVLGVKPLDNGAVRTYCSCASSRRNHMMLRTVALAGLIATGLSAQAEVISWNQWESGTGGTITTPETTVQVTFSGELPTSYYADYPRWLPAATYADGTAVENAPTGGIKRLHGGTDGVNAIEFSTAVVDPVLAIWSLGQPSLQARFDFIDATPVFVAGGVSQEYGGGAIVVDGQSVIGNEG